MAAESPTPIRDGMNFRIAKFFLDHSRITILSLIMLLSVGLVSTLSLKTTGFPAIVIPAVFIQTSYPGASADTVVRDVTQPIEGKIKDISGVKSYTSRSSNSFSTVSLSLESDANSDTVSSKVSAALQGLTLPTGVTTAPKVSTFDISGPSFQISVAGDDLAKVYAAYQKLRTDLGQNQDTASVTVINDLKPRVTVTIDSAKLAASKVAITDIQAALRTVGGSQPIGSDLTLDGSSQSLVTSLTDSSLEEVGSLPLKPGVTLSSVATVKYTYAYDTNPGTVLGYNNADGHGLLPAVTLQITAAKGTDTSAYAKQVREIMKGYSDADYVNGDPVKANGRVQIVEQYSVDVQNQEQVTEVTRGLIGGPLPISNRPLSEIGWILGGVQLVFLVMMALVSWRAAVVSSLAIPFSLLFSMIYLNVTGSSLNTIVLFSLVLAIGLVVDPALVVLESIQRKIDAGQRGKEAVLAAVRDVGAGLFIATLNNVIVFLPFGLISGIFGQIFAYIPAAIVPAIIGSYIVPLVLLAWAGSVLLRPGKRTSHNEEENMWPFAKWLVRLNQSILEGTILRRVVIILVAAILPLSLVGYFFSSGKITFTQFSGGADGNSVTVTGSYRPDVSREDRQATTEAILRSVSENPHLGSIYADGSGFSYSAYLKADHKGYTAAQLADSIKGILATYQDKFSDAQAEVQGTTGPTASYQVQIAAATEDPAKLALAAQAVGKVMATACLTGKTVTLDANCTGTKLVSKIDDGYTGKDNRTVEVLLDRALLAKYGLDAQGTQVNQVLYGLFPNDQAPAIGHLTVDGLQTNIYLEGDQAQPTTVAAIKAIALFSPTGQKLTLGDVATIVDANGSASISREKGRTQAIVQARLIDGHTDQGTAGQVTAAMDKYYSENSSAKTTELGLTAGSIASYTGGGFADFAKSFTELFEVLALAVFATYIVLAVFFDSLLQPLIVLFTIPLTFIGIFPALAYLGTKQFGFFEIIGMIILVGLVDNVAIFLIDAARHRMAEGMDQKTAIAHASGIRLRPVILTKLVALASLAPLAILSPFYRSISLVIIFGLLTSGFTSLFTTPILYIFSRWLSARYAKFNFVNKFFFIFLSIPYLIVMWAAYEGTKRRATK